MSMTVGDGIFFDHHGTYLHVMGEVYEGGVDLVVAEPTAFHREHGASLFDGEGWFTPPATEALQRLLRTHLSTEQAWVDLDAGWDSEPNFTVTVTLPGITHESTEDEAFDAAWPYIAELANRLDPGTFGVPYVIDEVRRALNGSPC